MVIGCWVGWLRPSALVGPLEPVMRNTHPRAYLQTVDEHCDFLSKQCSNTGAFTWVWTVGRTLSGFKYVYPLGPKTLVDHRSFLVRLLVAALPMQGVRGPSGDSGDLIDCTPSLLVPGRRMRCGGSS